MPLSRKPLLTDTSGGALEFSVLALCIGVAALIASSLVGFNLITAFAQAPL